jgi:hypothetical protein
MTRPPAVINAYNSAQVSLIIDQVAPRLRPGDQVALVNGNGGHSLDEGQLRQWVDQLVPHLPHGVTLCHHSSGLSNVEMSATATPSMCSSLLYDYEPNFEPEFTWDFASTLECFGKFATICHRANRQAVGYPTGRAILETGLLAYRWDYGQLRTCVDRLIVQTQHWAHLGAGAWNTALSKLQLQFSARGWSPEQIIPQVSIGGGPNAVVGSMARVVLEDAVRRGVGGVYVWWSPDAISDLVELLD